MITMLLYYELRHSFLSGNHFLETVGFLYYNIAGNPCSKQIEDLRIATPPALRA